MPALTRRRDDQARDEKWLIFYGDVRVGSMKYRRFDRGERIPPDWRPVQ